MRISIDQARHLTILCQGLTGQWEIPDGKEGAAQVIEKLGYIQIDTIAVVQRAHHHTLWTRHAGYSPAMLDTLLAEDRRVFEYWTHAASYVPMSDYRYYLPRMRAFARSKKTQRRMEKHADVLQHVRERLREEGALGSSDFKSDKRKRGPWWDWKPAKAALELLFSMGEVMVIERRNFQRIYDLTERVLPADVDRTEPTSAELARFTIRRFIHAHGIGTADEMGWRRGRRAHLADVLAESVEMGEITPVEVDGLEGERYAWTEALEHVLATENVGQTVHLLSPFDNLTIRRPRLAQLFGFDYKLECYHPAAKRQYGYFCLPILWGHRFVGRLDPKADRKARDFIVRGLFLEPDFEEHADLLPALAEKLWAFARFNECDDIIVETTEPAGIRSALRDALQEAQLDTGK